MTVTNWRIRAVLWLCLASGWCNSQTPLTLKQAVNAAKANNPALKAELYNVSISEADIVTARLRPNLVLNNQTLQLMDQKFFPPNTGYLNNRNRQVWWQLTKQFQLPAQRRYRIETAEQNLRLSQNQFNETARGILQDVAIKWVDVWTAQKQLDLLRLAKANTDSLVYINQLRLKNQVITATDAARTELLANQFALQIKTAQQTYNNALATFKLVLGGQEVSIDTTDSFDSAIPVSVDSLMNEALNNRTDIQVLRSSIDVANSNIRMQRAMAWPVPELGVIYNPQNSIPYVGFYGTIQIPIFSRNQGEIKKSHLLKAQSEQSLFATQMEIRTSVSNAFANYQVNKANLEAFKSVLQQAESILTSVRYAYLRGGTSIIDYLEAQRSWLETKQQYFDVLHAYRQTYVELLYASGLIIQLAQ